MFSNSRILMFLLFCFISLHSTVHSQQWYERGNPHFMSERDFDRLVTNPQTRTKGTVIMKFFTPWCRYCRYLKDIIDNLLQKEHWQITVYEINCDGDDHDFCKKQMGVRSYPKMSVFVNGEFKQSMDGFYPYQVVRELFVKYNHTEQIVDKVQENHIQQHNQQQSKVHSQNSKPKNKNIPNQQQQQQENFIQPQVITPIKQQQAVSIHHQETVSTKNTQKSQQQQQTPQIVQNKQDKRRKGHKKTHPEQQLQSKKTKNIDNPSSDQHTKQKNKKSHKQQQSHKQQRQQKQNSQHTIKGTTQQQLQPLIQQQQNIAIVDDNINQIKKQKQIIEQKLNNNINNKNKQSKVQTIDVTKVLTDNLSVHNYGKYLLYAVSIIIGGCYFVHIMKAEGQVKQQGDESRNSTMGNGNNSMSGNITIENSDLNDVNSNYLRNNNNHNNHSNNKNYNNNNYNNNNYNNNNYNNNYNKKNEKIHQQQNQQEMYMNEVEIRDEDL